MVRAEKEKKEKQRSRVWMLLFSEPLSWKWSMGLLAGISVVALMTFIVSGAIATSEQPYPKLLKVERIPLSQEKLNDWARSARKLMEAQDRGQITIPCQMLIELIEWGRRNPKALDDALRTCTPDQFLGVALSIELTRRNLRSTIEYEICMDEIDQTLDAMEGPADWIRYPDPPNLEGGGEADLTVYLDNEILVEDTLDILLPNRPPLVPSWEEPDDSSLGPVDNVAPKNESQKISWRVVSRSRYGPRVLRSR